jgi:type II secretory ATPase GspE/PulE/Tfp pilus assembly ATPase PilB-like protein
MRPSTDSIHADPDAPVAVQDLLTAAHAAHVSDIHLQSTARGVDHQWRVDGVLHVRPGFPHPLGERMIGRLKYLARLRTFQDSLPQEGRIAASEAGLPEDVRVSTYPTVSGEKVVLRLFRGGAAVALGDLGLPESTLAALRTALAQPTGLILLTGPAGSGKSTTGHAALLELAAEAGRHLVSVEDPVEIIVPGVMQTEVNEARGLTFANAVRHLLRQDPQVLLIGEIRDEETANLAVRAALTGHLVLSTLHAGSCRGVLERLRLLVSDPFAVAASLSLVINQRLMRRVCAHCGGNRCDRCAQTGFSGRFPICEHLALTDAQRPALRAGSFDVFQPTPTLAESAAAAVAAGITLSSEIRRILGT